MIENAEIIARMRELTGPDGTAPGKSAFAAATGITESDWAGKHWRNWSDAVQEAGLRPNTMNTRLPSGHVLEQYASAARELRRLPTNADLKLYARANPGFPSHNTFSKHFGSKAGLIEALREWCSRRSDATDIEAMLPEPAESIEPTEEASPDGYVYLLKSGLHYKIGRSDQIERRIKEITVSLPEAVDLVHVIRTDDPAGIEAYWHRRFSEMRANGEWFKLTKTAVKAFKRRKFQ